ERLAPQLASGVQFGPNSETQNREPIMKQPGLICLLVVFSAGLALAKQTADGYGGTPAPTTDKYGGITRWVRPCGPLKAGQCDFIPIYDPPSSTDCRNKADQKRQEYYAAGERGDDKAQKDAQDFLSGLAERCGGWGALSMPPSESGKGSGTAAG